jgi:hypothetical protein
MGRMTKENFDKTIEERSVKNFRGLVTIIVKWHIGAFTLNQS